MSIPADSYCLECQLKRHLARVRTLGTEAQATAFARGYMKLVLDAPEGVASPCYGPETTKLMQQMYGIDEDVFRQEKQDSNDFVLTHLDAVQAKIDASQDPLYAALQFSVLGNYLDFSSLYGKVSFSDLEAMLSQALELDLDKDCYRALQEDLARGGKLLYLTDNAGEIGFDRLLAQEIHRKYPNLSITFCVRGAYAANDATREDAAAVGIPFPVIDNGNAVAGTVPELLGKDAKEAFEQADIIFSKGMGNVETLYGCGKNIYYAFLIKCTRFSLLFRKDLMTPMLVRDGNAQE